MHSGTKLKCSYLATATFDSGITPTRHQDSAVQTHSSVDDNIYEVEPGEQEDRYMSPTRILVVDDFTPWRQMVRSTIQGRPDLHVIDEASDGLEAVEKAEKLKPDLITLDIGLPKLNGVSAAM